MPVTISELKGKEVVATTDGVRLRKNAGTDASSLVLYSASKGENIGRATGQAIVDISGKYNWLQIVPDQAKVKSPFVYVSSDYIMPAPVVTKSDAQRLLDQILSTDLKIRDNLIRMSKSMGVLSAHKVNTDAYRKVQNDLLVRMLSRHREIQRSSLVKVEKQFDLFSGSSSPYNPPDWSGKNVPPAGAFMMGLGIIQVPLWIILTAVVVGVAYLTYAFLKPHYDSGQIDLKTSEFYKSELLAKAKTNLTPAEQRQFDQELEQWAKDNYKKGASGQGFLQWLTGIGPTEKFFIGAGVFTWLLIKLKQATK